MGSSLQQAGGGQRKYGRHQRKPSNKRYNMYDHRDKNKAKRILRLMKRFPLYRAYNVNSGVSIIINKEMRR